MLRSRKCKKDSYIVSLFVLSGSASSKAARGMLMKLTPGFLTSKMHLNSENACKNWMWQRGFDNLLYSRLAFCLIQFKDERLHVTSQNLRDVTRIFAFLERKIVHSTILPDPLPKNKKKK